MTTDAPTKHGRFNHDASMPSGDRFWVTPQKIVWTEERIEFLKARWGHPDWSSTTIGKALGTTRNAIIGKAHRLGLMLPKTQVKELRANRNRNYTTRGKIYAVRKAATGGKALKIIEALAATEPSDLPPEQPVNPVKFTELNERHCRWPCDGAGLDTIFCGDDAVRGLSYCARHCRLAYTPGRRVSREEYELEQRARVRALKAQAA